MHRTADIIERLLAKVVELGLGLASHLLEGTPRQGDASRHAFILDAGGDVQAIAKDVIALDDDVADVDVDAKDNPGRLAIKACTAIAQITAATECLSRLRRRHARGAVDRRLREADGIQLPTRRRAYVRGPDNRPVVDLLLVSIDISNVRLA